METLGLSKSTPKSRSRFKEFFAPDLSTAPSAQSACEAASNICFVIAGLTTIVAFFTSLFSLIDAVLFAMIGLGLRRKSRIAAVAGFFLYIIEQIIMTIELRGFPGILAILFIVLLFNGMRAAFAYQHIQTEQKKKESLPLTTQ
jgi:hypothetical protein